MTTNDTHVTKGLRIPVFSLWLSFCRFRRHEVRFGRGEEPVSVVFFNDPWSGIVKIQLIKNGKLDLPFCAPKV